MPLHITPYGPAQRAPMSMFVRPSMVTTTSIFIFIFAAIALLPGNVDSNPDSLQSGSVLDTGLLQPGERVVCSSAFGRFAALHPSQFLERGVVAGSATLTVISIFIALAARGKHIEGAYAGTGLAIMLQSILFYALLHTGHTTVYCVGTPTGGVRLEVPLRYAYWLLANVKMQAALYDMVEEVSARRRVLSMASSSASILFGFGSAMVQAYSPTSILLLVLSCLSMAVWVWMYASVCLQVSRWPADRSALKRSVLFCVPFATSFPVLLIPCTWVACYMGLLPVHTGQLLYCIGEFMDKFTMCNLLAVSDLPQHIDKVRLELLEAEAKRSAAQAKEGAMRSIMRYLFHELRVPLNSIVLGLEDSKEAIEDLLGQRTSTAEVNVCGTAAATGVQEASHGADAAESGRAITSPAAPSLYTTTMHRSPSCSTPYLQPPPAAARRASHPGVSSHHHPEDGVVTVTTQGSGQEAATSNACVGVYSSTLHAARVWMLNPHAEQDRVHGEAPASPGMEGAAGQRRAKSGASTASDRASPSVYMRESNDGDAVGYGLHDVTRILSMCHTSALGLGRLLDDFLSLEKIEQGKLKMEMGSVQIKRMVDETLRLFKPAVQSKELQLRRAAAAGLPTTLVGDDHKLRQCLANFVSNAIKFSPARGHILVQLSVVYSEPTAVHTGVEAVPLGVPSLSWLQTPTPTPSPSPSPSPAPSPKARAAGGNGESIVDFRDLPDPVVPVVTLSSWCRLPLPRVLCTSLGWPGSAQAGPRGDAGAGLSVRILQHMGFGKAFRSTTSGADSTGVGSTFLSPDAVLVPSEPPRPMQDTPAPGLVPYLRVSVQDSGVGISPADQAKLFQPFQQIRAGALQKGNGTGLGLAIVRQIINLSGGFVGVQSVEGQGSTFYFCVPLEARREPALPAGLNEVVAVDDGQGTGVAVASLTGHETGLEATHDASQAVPVLTTRRQPTVPSGYPSLFGVAGLPSPRAALGSPVSPRTSCSRGSKSPPTSRHASTGRGSRAASMDNQDATATLPGSVPGASDSPLPMTVPGPGHGVAGALQGAEGIMIPLEVAVVVDDIAANRQLLARMLKRRGVAECYEAADGVEALSLAQRLSREGKLRTVQAWLMDEEMPVMNGSKAIAELRSKYGLTCVMLSITGNALSEDQAALVAAGADAVLPKPVLLQSLQDMLGRYGLILPQGAKRSRA